MKFWRGCLSLSKISQTLESGSGGGSGSSGKRVSTAGNGLLAARAVPDTSSLALDGALSAERAQVTSVLLNLELLALATER